MKFLGLLLASVFITIGFFGCKSDSAIENPDPTGCGKYETDVPQIIVNGKDEAGAAFSIAIDTTKNETGYKYYWQLPNGNVYNGAVYKIDILKNANRGTYFAYYITEGGCKSYKAKLEIKAPGLSLADAPCSLKPNYVDMDTVAFLFDKNMPEAKISKYGGHAMVKCGIRNTTAIIEMEFNTAQLLEGEYTMVSSFNLSSKPNGVFFFCAPDLGSYWKSENGKLYVVKNNGVFEIIVCNAEMTRLYRTDKNFLKMRIVAK